ncbi:hypothetical protein [Flavobacterium sp.]|uniref:hypothetical protein n=1 Tax=Flavobacterium sp. TaxID=239 RepID=UPI0026184C6E|nr:hypothetical protein [Flavobacterium sp.]
MRKLFYLLIMIAFVVAFYNQRQEKPNVIIAVIAVVIFMFGMMKLSSKIESKNKENDEQ